MPTPQLDAGANIAPAGHPEAVATAPTSSAETGVDDCDDGVPCWCGEASPLYDDEGLDATCGGFGTLTCRCGGDLCVCHHHGEVECSGCADCDESYEGDDEGAFEDGDELDEESGEVCYECGATSDLGRSHGRWICDDCDDAEHD